MFAGQHLLRVTFLCLFATFSVGCLSRKKDQASSTPAEAPPAAAYPESPEGYADTNAAPPATAPAPYQVAAAAEKKPEPFELRADEELVTHQIQSGENLSVIASKYDSSIRRIQAANGMTNTKIYAGKTLKVPARKKMGVASSAPSLAPAPPSAAPAPASGSYSGGRFGAAPSVSSASPAPSATTPPVYQGPADGSYVSNNAGAGTIAPPPVDPASTSYPRVTTPAVPPSPEEAFPTPNLGGRN